MEPRTKIISAAAAVAVALGLAGTGTAVAMDKTVTVRVGDSARQVSSFGFSTTVSDVLRTGGVVLEGRDQVSPALDTVVSDGQVITVTIIRPRLVTVTHDGATSTGNTYETTVAGVLKERSVAVNPEDRLSLAVDAPLVDGATVAVKRVAVTETTETTAVPFESTTVNDATLAKGTTKVTTPGVNGVLTKSYRVTSVDGVEESRTFLSEAVTTPAVTQVTAVGTKVAPAPSATSAAPTAGSAVKASGSGAAINLANAAMWDRVAKCESTNNWSINTGNGYYGGLQFSASTWLAYGGADFAPRADLATREQQITVANRVYAGSGLSQWSCKG